jgi:hypothetical protein
MAIVFIHRGYSPYLEFSLRQARAADPGAEIVLLGDRENDRFPFLRHVDATQAAYREAAEEVARVYEHLSQNPFEFELGCFQRWFVLLAFLRSVGWDDVLHLDSDVMLYATEAELRHPRLEGRVLGCCRPASQPMYRWNASAHVSYWTRSSLEDFCGFIVRSYSDREVMARYEGKWDHVLRHDTGGGICDMTALYLFLEGLDQAHFANLTQVLGDAACDKNLNKSENEWPDEYRMAGGYKELAWEDGRPFGFNTRLRRPVRFLALHCQGAAKGRMAACYRGPAFPGQRKVGGRLSWYYHARRKASRVVQSARHLKARLARR